MYPPALSALSGHVCTTIKLNKASKKSLNHKKKKNKFFDNINLEYLLG